MRDQNKVRCPHKIELVGVTFQCQDNFGHWGKCWNEPEGCAGEARISWSPSPEEKAAELSKVLKAEQS